MKKGILIPLYLFFVAVAFAGGFQLSVESGSSKEEALIIKTFGCHTPSDAKLTGTAEGIVKGERKSVRLKIKHNKKGIFSVAKQWENDGVWVVIIKGNYNGMNSNAIVQIDHKSNIMLAKGETAADLKIKIVHQNVSDNEVNKLLDELNKKYSKV